jgi:hypothetical protein
VDVYKASRARVASSSLCESVRAVQHSQQRLCVWCSMPDSQSVAVLGHACRGAWCDLEACGASTLGVRDAEPRLGRAWCDKERESVRVGRQ